jgi:CRP/FNR family transcriptional regulator, cyclic AMP receptor protein
MGGISHCLDLTMNPLPSVQPSHHRLADAQALINTLPSARLRRLAQLGDTRLFHRHTVLLQEGTPGEDLVIILEGRLRVFSNSGGSRPREVTYGICGPGDVVGEMSMGGDLRSASVQALTPTWCSVVARAQLLGFIAQEPAFALDLLATVVARARLATQTVRQVLFTDTYGRLCELLTRNTERLPDGRLLVRERMTHALMAQQIGSSREMVSRLLKDLIIGGYISRNERRQYFICAPLPLRW